MNWRCPQPPQFGSVRVSKPVHGAFHPGTRQGFGIRRAGSLTLTSSAECALFSAPYAEAHRHPLRPHHRRRPDCHRAGLRIRLFRHASLQSAQGRGLPRRPGELQPGRDRRRPESADRTYIEPITPECVEKIIAREVEELQRISDRQAGVAADPRAGRLRSTPPWPSTGAGTLREIRRRDDRRQRRGDRARRNPAGVQRPDALDRAGRPH